MVGRNEPCPCGSGKKYKKCCERVVSLSSIEKARAERDSRLKHDLLVDLQRWFTGRISSEMQKEWAQRFKQLMQLSSDQPIPQEYSTYFHFWLLFDAPCLNRRRPVEVWLSTIRNAPHKERLARQMSESVFTCYEISQMNEDTMTFTTLDKEETFLVHKGKSIPREKLVFTRLLRVGHHYELFGPYTSFVHGMRGEILVQLEKYNHPEEERQESTTWENGWKVFGWSIRRTEEIEQVMSAPAMAEPVVKAPFWPAVEPKEEELPLRVMQHLEQFFLKHVAPLQKGTQNLYSRTLELLYKYLSMRFGQTFDWSMLDEEGMYHFLSVWYLDQGKVSPPSAKIFLNTLKYLFRWLEEEGISDVYQTYKKAYKALIHTLPVTIEAKKWLLENGIMPDDQNAGVDQAEPAHVVMLAFTSTGPVLLVEDKRIPVHLLGIPAMWSGHRFWVHGAVRIEPSGCYFTRIDGLYPIISSDKQLKMLGHKG